MSLLRLCITNFLLIASLGCYSQKIDSLTKQIQDLPNNYYKQVDQKLVCINKKLAAKSEKYLSKFNKQEDRLQRKLNSIDSTSATFFTGTKERYTELISQVNNKTSKILNVPGQYNSYLDTLGTSLKFLKGFGDVSKATASLKNLSTLQGKLQASEKIKQYITERKQQLKEMLAKYTKLPKGLAKELSRLNKTAYYYSAQINEYKAMLKDPVKAERKALELLNKLPAFQKFMQKNSQLASMFNVPGNGGSINTGVSLRGLQTRASVERLIERQVAAGGQNGQQLMQQNLAQAHNELNQLKDKVNKFGGGSSDIDMPDFKPNNQKTKSFFQRLEYGTNVQFSKSDNLFPSTTDIGLSLGYKLNDKNIIGVGMSYKMGMGTIRHIVISHEGIGLRSFVDYKIKKSLFLSGGYEMNYNARFKSIDELKRFNEWQSSGLIGLSKKYKVSKKVKGEMKILYDFLANTHRPVTQPVIFRIGYFR